MVLCAWMNLIDGDQRTQLHGFVPVVSTLSLTRLRPILEILCTMDPEAKLLTTLLSLPRPLGVLSSMLEVGHPMIRHLAYEFVLPMSRRLNRELAPMSRRLNREMPLRSQGLSWFRTNFHSSPTTLTVMIYE